MKNNKRKGFTLTELIIVIVIIGILAAVLIPSVSGYIKKAKISKGEQEAREMNTILAAEAIYQDKEYFEPYEVVKLVEEANFKLESQLKDYRFWYDASENKVKYLSMENAFSSVSAASNSFTNDCIEALSQSHPEYRYIDTYDDALTALVETVRYLLVNGLKNANITDNANLSESDMSKVLDQMDKALNSAAESVSKIKIDGLTDSVKKSIVNFSKEFDTSKSIYVSECNFFNRAYCVTTKSGFSNINSDNITFFNNIVSVDVKHMVFDTDIEVIPGSKYEVTLDSEKVTFELTFSSTSINIPGTVTNIQNGAFTSVVFCVSIVVSSTTICDPEALSDIAKEALTEKSSNVNFVPLYLGTDFTISYENAEAKLNDGTNVSYTASNGEKIKLNTVEFSNTSSDSIISRYLVPTIEFTKTNKIDFKQIDNCVIRRSLLENICTYTAILVDKDLNCYKVESFGYIMDLDWSIDQSFMTRDANTLETTYGATEATVNIYLPTYVYNYTNFKGACIEVSILPQYIDSKKVNTLTGTIDVYNGIILSNDPIKFYIEDGVYDSELNKYVYKKTIENLGQYSIDIEGSDSVSCNQISIGQISIYTGNINDNGNPNTNELNYLFIRYYK